ncbi:hypothetical protein KAT92_06565, partial [Candidatus Babeliales bacterium]|nr:hypothetical protein [Candidatus Babeliales bacterium]
PILDGSGDLPQTLFPGLLQKYVISDDLLHSHDGESYSASDAYVKVKTITINTLSPTPVTLRIKFDIRTNNSPLHAYGRIYKNGVAVGTERSRNSTGYVTFSEDISFAQGDTLELWVHRSGTCWCYYRNFRVYGNDEWTLADAIENSNMGSAADAWDASNS